MMVVEFAAIDSTGTLIGSAITNVMVDSGADLTMLNADIAAQMGLDLGQMNLGTMRGIGGTTNTFEPQLPILARLCDKWVPISVCFERDRDMNLLGRGGAFESMQIVFLQSVSTMLATPL